MNAGAYVGTDGEGNKFLGFAVEVEGLHVNLFLGSGNTAKQNVKSIREGLTMALKDVLDSTPQSEQRKAEAAKKPELHIVKEIPDGLRTT